MLPDEAETAVANLHRGEEVSQVHPTVRVHLEPVSLRKVSQHTSHRAPEELDLLIVEQELAFAAAMRAELFPEISVRTAFLEHASPPWAVGIRPRLMKFRSPGRPGGPPPSRYGGRAPPVVLRTFGPPVSTGSCGERMRGSRRRSARSLDRS